MTSAIQDLRRVRDLIDEKIHGTGPKEEAEAVIAFAKRARGKLRRQRRAPSIRGFSLTTDDDQPPRPIPCVLRDGVLVEAARCGGCGAVFDTIAALDEHRKTCRRPGLDEAKQFNTRPFPGISPERKR